MGRNVCLEKDAQLKQGAQVRESFLGNCFQDQVKMLRGEDK
jgi:hypothetical protein